MKTYFKSGRTVTELFSAIDSEQGIIRGVNVVTEGEAKGHGVYLNTDFINRVIELGNAQSNGVKARFGHPNMCSDALGTYLGVLKNFRSTQTNGKYGAIADMYLSDSAKVTPNGDLHTYILTLASSEPDKFGTSIVFEPGDNLNIEGDDRTFATITNLFAADFVDSPAATDGLFDTNSLAAKVTEFIDDNPAILKYLKDKPEVIKDFLSRYDLGKLNTKTDMTKQFIKLNETLNVEALESTQDGIYLNETQLESIESKFDEKDDTIAAQAEEIAILKAKIAELEGESKDDVAPELAAKDALIAELSEKITDKDAKIAELEAKAIVQAVDKMPALSTDILINNRKLSQRALSYIEKKNK